MDGQYERRTLQDLIVYRNCARVVFSPTQSKNEICYLFYIKDQKINISLSTSLSALDHIFMHLIFSKIICKLKFGCAKQQRENDSNSYEFMQGIWSGMIGGTLMQTIILIWVTYRTDWNKEVTSLIIFNCTCSFASIAYLITLGQCHNLETRIEETVMCH